MSIESCPLNIKVKVDGSETHVCLGESTWVPCGVPSLARVVVLLVRHLPSTIYRWLAKVEELLQ